MKDPVLFQLEIITNSRKYIEEIKKSSSPEPMSEFQLNFAHSIFGLRGFKFLQMKGPTLFQGKIITKYPKYIDEIKKSSSPEPLSQFHNLTISTISWHKASFGEGDSGFFK